MDKDLEDIKFCESCGHEGSDVICPVCGKAMKSLEDEIDRISKIEKEKSDIFDEEISLEEEAENEDNENI